MANDSVITTNPFNAANAISVIEPTSVAQSNQMFDANGNLIDQNTGRSLSKFTWAMASI
jgi:hypothetical protein